MQTDSLFYELFQACPSLLFELIGQSNSDADSYTFRSVELKQTAFRIDGVFLPRDTDLAKNPAYFVEVQFQRDEQLYARLFTEALIFLRQNPAVQHWYVVVMYGDRSCEPRNIGAFAPLLNLPQVNIIYLNELAETDTESVELGLVRLIVEPPQNAIAKARQLVQRAQDSFTRLSSSVIIEMVETIIIYKFPNLSWQEVAAMFGLSELKQTRVYQQGREEGREEGEQSLILRQLSRCIGELPDTLRDQVIALPLETLEELGEALLDFEEIEDLQNWLLAHQQRRNR